MAALNTRDMLLHGEAVNIDMAITTQLAYHRGMLTLTDRNRVFNVMEGLGLALWHESCSDLPMLLRVRLACYSVLLLACLCLVSAVQRPEWQRCQAAPAACVL